MILECTWHHDPGRAWLKVDLADLAHLRATYPDSPRFSAYSYADRRAVYLEEDCDSPAFLVWCAKNGVAVAAAKVIHDGPAPLRKLRSFHDGASQ